jgi:hypothetical protein
MPSDETIVCDPVEFIPSRVELGLDALGLDVVEAEWGDSDHELFLIRQEKGEIPGDRHPPNRTVTLKLQARTTGTKKRTNLVPNPNFEVNTAKWGAGGGGVRTNAGAAIARDATQAFDGTAACKVTTPGVTNSEGIDGENVIPVVKGKTYRVSAYVKGNAGGELLNLSVGGGAVGAVKARQLKATKEWQRVDIEWTATETGNTGVAVCTQGTNAYIYWVDCFLWEESSALGVYFPTLEQLKKGLAAWTGTANESTATMGNTVAEAIQRLQMKVGRWQDEGGFVKRVPDSTAGFSTPVAFVVYTAVLGGVHGWLLAHRQVANEITLVLTVGPYCYGTKEVESAEFTASEARQLEYELAKVQGTAPGIFRLRVKNEGAGNWLTSINAMQSRDHSSAATALLSYEAEALTLLGLAKKATRTGGSGAGENVVRSGSLANSWQAVLLSKISATGEHLTHVGPRRIVCRIWDPNTTAGNIRLQLQWRVLGATKWISNDEERTYVVGNFSFIDFGEVRPEKAVLGNQRWEFRIVAKTESAVGEEVQLDQFHILPTEQFAVVQEELETLSGGQAIWEDTFALLAAGFLTGKTAPIGGTYEVGALKGGDFKTALVAGTYREEKGTGRMVVAGASSAANCLLEGTLAVPSTEGVRGFLKSGFVLRYASSANYLLVGVERGHSGIVGHPLKEDVRIRVSKVVAGVETTLINGGGIYDWFTSKWKIAVNAEGKILIEVTSESGRVESFVAEDKVLKTGEALASGKMGIYDILETGATGEPVRSWSEVKAYGSVAGEEELKQAVCYAGRSIEFRSDGVYRQHASAEVWTRLTPDGFLPYAPPSGLEARLLKGIFMPSIGNFNAQPDSEKYKLSAKVFYFPGFHFASEAA